MARNPWMKWYPADWRQEPTLRMCSRAARSLWVDILGLMHEANPYGYLSINGRILDTRQLAAVLGDSEADVAGWLAELESNGVLSRAENGAIISRRMIRDKAKEEKNRENGKAGGNPRLKAEVNPKVKAQKPEARSQKPDPLADANGENAPQAAPPHKPAEPDLTLPANLDRSKRGTRLPTGWRPSDDDWAWAILETGDEAIVVRENDKFTDHWAASAGKNATKVDWTAAWRNWIRKAKEYGAKPATGNGWTSLLNAEISRASRG